MTEALTESSARPLHICKFKRETVPGLAIYIYCGQREQNAYWRNVPLGCARRIPVRRAMGYLEPGGIRNHLVKIGLHSGQFRSDRSAAIIESCAPVPVFTCFKGLEDRTTVSKVMMLFLTILKTLREKSLSKQSSNFFSCSPFSTRFAQLMRPKNIEIRW